MLPFVRRWTRWHVLQEQLNTTARPVLRPRTATTATAATPTRSGALPRECELSMKGGIAEGDFERGSNNSLAEGRDRLLRICFHSVFPSPAKQEKFRCHDQHPGP